MSKEGPLLKSHKNGVTTIIMNRPKQLNGWTSEMMLALRDTFAHEAKNPETKVMILSGKDPYYCAGVNLSGTMQMKHPQKLHDFIVRNNAAIFDAFLDFPKPLIVAANGPAIGACVTSATLCDAIIASEKATFSTPFAKLGIVPEGCSSVHFERIMGPTNAKRMLDEGWAPTAKEALEAGLVQEVVPHNDLLECAQARGEQFVKEKKVRNLIKDNLVSEYKDVNMKESYALADAFLATPFLAAQYNFLKQKGKSQQANIFWFLKMSRPLWSLLLKKK
eukprot:01537.XXX_1807_857_1 [CDS] Oithona nana genome sequencing.